MNAPAQVATTQAALAFNGVTFDIIPHDGEPWIRGHQIGDALGYKNPLTSINNLYNSNTAEFTSAMTALVELHTTGGPQAVRIFSLRGAHLLAIFARTAKAAEFRRWVLDLLDQEAARLQGLAKASSEALSAPPSNREEINARAHAIAIQYWQPIRDMLLKGIEPPRPEDLEQVITAAKLPGFGYAQLIGPQLSMHNRQRHAERMLEWLYALQARGVDTQGAVELWQGAMARLTDAEHLISDSAVRLRLWTNEAEHLDRRIPREALNRGALQ